MLSPNQAMEQNHSMPAASLFLQFILLFSFLAAKAGGATNGGDELALLAFKSKIAADPSAVLSYWNSSLDFCQWPGVTCGGATARVTALELDSFGLSGTISPSLANLTYLQRLHLPNNQLHGPIPPELGSLRYLLHLNLSYNYLIDGPIPATLCGGPAAGLRSLDLRQNSLTGELPANLGHCSAIQTLDLRSNMLSGDIPDFLGNLSTLTSLTLSFNNLTGGVPPSLGKLRSLSTIDISGNLLVGEVPPSLWNLSSLIELDLYQNNLTGALPDDMCRRLPRLQVLQLAINDFYGAIPSSISNASLLKWVAFDQNGFTGQVPGNLGSLKQLQWLTLAINQLGGSESGDLDFIAELTNCSNLQRLDAFNNRLQGKLPSSIANLSSTSLQWLVLGGSNISGAIPPGIGGLTQLAYLVLEFTTIQGSIPATIGDLINMEMMYLDGNMLSGEIPSSVGNLTRMNTLHLGANQLAGRIPESLGSCQNLEILFLGFNQLTGGVPIGIFSIQSLSIEVSFAYNSLSGPLPVEVGRMTNIQTFDVAHNGFSGDIPGALAGCQHLQVLFMENNSFEGPIPPEFASLKGLQTLDLSENSLSGSIPAFLQHLNLISLNLSFNNFSGEVPNGGVFLNASATSLLGNDHLCGGSPVFILPPCPKPVEKRHKHRNIKVIAAIIIASIGALSLILLLFFALHCIRRQRSKMVALIEVMEDDQQLIRISYDALSTATGGFSSTNLIGAGGFGSVYKGVIVDGHGNPRDVAVKVFDLERVGAPHTFVAECEALRSVRHRNLVRIITACSSIDSQGNEFKALVFEFMPNGSLDSWLHPEEDWSNGNIRQRLSLVQRLDIAVDIASALEYLHRDGPSQIVHCDLKPSNVLLDNEMAARVGDFGLAKFIQTTESSSSSVQNSATTSLSNLLRGSIGYVAPEYGMGSRASTQGDVYSFGILLLEMLTGKKPTDEAFKDGLSLHSFVRMACRNDLVMEIIDPVLDISDDQPKDGSTTFSMKAGALDCVQSMLSIALRCSNESPANRMQIEDVVHQLRTIKLREA